MAFITLRDRYGVTQVQLSPDEASALKPERCIKITGEVTLRPDGQNNAEMDTGDIEIL